jgi:uncharacterized RDD family membrane protein YckC
MEGLNLSSIQKRALAFTIDEVIMALLVFIIFYDHLDRITTPEDIVSLTNSMFGYIIAIKVIYQLFFIWKYGATMGKIIVKIRVIDIHTLDNPTLVSSLIRSLVRIVSESLFYFGYLWGALTPTRQTWHDKSATSVVVDV